MQHLPSLCAVQGLAPALSKPVQFAAGPAIKHVSLEKAVMKSVGHGDLATYRTQTRIDGNMLDGLRQLPSDQRYAVYAENSHLRKALGMKGVSRFSFGRSTAPAAPLLQNPPQGLGWQRFHTELACFVTSTDKQHRQMRGLQEIRKGLTNATNSSSAVPTLQVLLKHANLMAMTQQARDETKQLLHDVLTGKFVHVQLKTQECAQLLCSALESAACGDTGLEDRITRDVDGMPEGFRGEMLVLLLEAASALKDPHAARKLVFDLALRSDTAYTTGNRIDNKSALLTFLNADPPPSLTEAASSAIARELIERHDPNTSPVAVLQFILPVAMSMHDAKAAGELVAAALGKLDTPSASKSDPPVGAALLAMPMRLREATAACLLRTLDPKGAPSPSLAQGLAHMLKNTSDEEGAQPLHEYATAAADLLSRLDGKDWHTYRTVFDAANHLMQRIDATLGELAKGNAHAGETKEATQLAAARRSIIGAISDGQIRQLTPLNTARPERKNSKDTDKRNQAIAGLRKDIAALVVKHDGVLPVCSEQRLQSLRPEINTALKSQAVGWLTTINQALAGKAAGTARTDQAKSNDGPRHAQAQMLKFQQVLASRDLVSQLAVSPLMKIGEGGMGTAWLYQTSSPAMPLVVLKFPLVGDDVSANVTQQSSMGLQNEFDVYAKLHPGRDRDTTRICWTYGMIDKLMHPETGQPCKAMVMEALDGFELHDVSEELGFEAHNRHLLTDYPAIYQYAVKVLLEAGKELACAGYVHGDLKPGNILVLRDGSMKVIDLGLARQMGETRAGASGTPGYSAPEKKAEAGYSLGTHKYYVPAWTSDVFEGAATALSSIEPLWEVRDETEISSPPALSNGKVFHTDENGIPYRTPGHILRVSSNEKESASDAGHPIGAFEKYYAKALAKDPEKRPSLEEALREPYVADPLESEAVVQAALSRAIVQYTRRKNGEQSSAPRHVSDPLLKTTAPLLKEEALSGNTLVPADKVYEAWVRMHPGMTIARVARAFDTVLKGGAEYEHLFLPALEAILQSLGTTIGRKEDMDRLQDLVQMAMDKWDVDETILQAPPEEAPEITTDAPEIKTNAGKVLDAAEALLKHEHDVRSLAALELAKCAVLLSASVVYESGGMTAVNEPELHGRLTEVAARCENTIKAIEASLSTIRDELIGNYQATPSVLRTTHPVSSIADKLAKPPNVRSGFKSNREATVHPGWMGWKPAGTKKSIDIDAEIQTLAAMHAHGGAGIDLSEEDIATLMQWRDDIRESRDRLLDVLQKYWGTGNLQKDDQQAFFGGIGTITDSTLGTFEDSLRARLGKLERMMRVIEANENKAKDADPQVDALTRKERFAVAIEKMTAVLERHVDPSSKPETKYPLPRPAYYELKQNGRTTFSNEPQAGATRRMRFSTVYFLEQNQRLGVGGRNTGEDIEGVKAGKTKGEWVVGKGEDWDVA